MTIPPLPSRVEAAMDGASDAGVRIPEASTSGEIVSLSPTDTRRVVGRFPWRLESVESAVALAREAQPAWEDAPLEAKLGAMARLREALRARREELASL